ncbi:DUF4328 domain-containing protein [Kineosporia sp. A_224]|uniref:DUF4328 domain-containing protein n=1 Tax=Kineosporia sp. A_224 TaxID=1962180 RepID=UPI000B4B7278|nr:DUF4328 domain-containing protein [Kineosporia sp. A_224]
MSEVPQRGTPDGPADPAVMRWDAMFAVGADDVARARRPLRPLSSVVLGLAAAWTAIAWVRWVDGYDHETAMAVTLVASWVAASVWLGRLRDAAEVAAPGSARRSPVWASLGWVVPIVQLWFPKQVVDDAWTALSRLPGRAAKRRTGWWWAAWLVLFFIFGGASRQAPLTADERLWTAVGTTVAFVLWAAVVRSATAAHDGPPLSPGWRTSLQE